MNNTNAVVCIGELLIDFFCTDIEVALVEGSHFLKQAGGAPANVSAAISRLGGNSLFAGKVGDDPFGHFLKKTLEAEKVDTSMLVLDPHSSTTLAFVSLQADGERDFTFHRGADGLLKLDELDLPKMMKSRVIHFGSATAMLEGFSQETYFQVMKLAKENHIFISFDPNYREFLWKGNIEGFEELALKALSYADFVKVSEEELQLLTGTKNLEEGVQILHQYGDGAKWVCVTLGKNGTFISNGKQMAIVESIPVKAIDATGAGDAFVGATLFQIAQLENPLQMIHEFEKMKEVTSFSNKVGALVCTQMGAISSLPTYELVVSHG
ncbi:carbohydrate kinase [Ammoniphilus sp. YIM 78166]|uniref:carbohydrate kinase family protein n=1 Tax=Ammoniphilus sp. YIM 78166 TaxID=1644106 RepID=UPI00106F659B|nr:carbohydrate kinase [Ammoniphilus sp. YIM 78166]